MFCVKRFCFRISDDSLFFFLRGFSIIKFGIWGIDVDGVELKGFENFRFLDCVRMVRRRRGRVGTERVLFR